MRFLPLVLLTACWVTPVELATKLGTTEVPPDDTVVVDTVDSDPADTVEDTDPPEDTDPVLPDSPACADEDIRGASGDPVADGTMAGAGDDFSSTCDVGPGGQDVALWWEPPGSGCWIVSTSRSDIDTTLSLWDADCTTELACNDDHAGTRSSDLQILAEPGDERIIVVDGADDDEVDYWGLSVVQGIENPWDLDVTGTGALGSGNNENAGATLPPADGPQCFGTDGADVILRYTAPSDGVWRFDTSGTDFDAVLSAHGLCSTDAIACDDASTDGAEEIAVALQAGEQILIRIAGYGFAPNFATGNWSLNVRRD
jgi:hypothetical protein